MTVNDQLGNVLSHIYNCEKVGKPETIVKPGSKVILKVLEIMKNNNYIGEFSHSNDSRHNPVKVNLVGKINRCGVIKPRFPFKFTELGKFEKRFLPGKNIGIIIVSTSKGLMTHEQAIKDRLGGKLIAYVY